MSDFVIRRAELDAAPVLAALRWRFEVEEEGGGAPGEKGNPPLSASSGCGLG